MFGRHLALIAAVILTVAAVTQAQPPLTSHTLLGKVTDTTGRPLAGVAVELINPASTGSARTVVTDREGRYRIEKVVPGLYVLTVKLAGFGSVVRDIEIGGGPETFEYDVRLTQLGAGPPSDQPAAAQPSRRVICGMTVITPPAGIDPGIVVPKPPPSAPKAKPTIRAVQPTLCWEPSADMPLTVPKR